MNFKNILFFFTFFSFVFSIEFDAGPLGGFKSQKTEYSIGLNDKTTFYGLISKSWIQETDYGESYIIAGGLGMIGSCGYGRTYYFSKGRFFSPNISLTGFGYYLLAIHAIGGLGISANLGLDITTIKWKNNELKLQFGLFTGYDPINNKSILIPAEDGPSFIMPSFSIKVRFGK